jgi:hypothetical protein
MSAVPATSQRLALPADAARISALMRASVLELFPRCYDAAQTASAAVHIAHLDGRLIADGTYVVHEAGDEGFTALTLGATLPGLPLYRALGFREVERFTLTMPDAVAIECVAMERCLTSPGVPAILAG